MLVSPCVVFKACDTSRSAGAASALLNGLEVRRCSSCSKCGCTTALISSEKSRLSLRCASCRAHREWVSDATERFMQTIVERFGRPTKPIEIHRKKLIELSPPPSGPAANDNQDIIAPEKAKNENEFSNRNNK